MNISDFRAVNHSGVSPRRPLGESKNPMEGSSAVTNSSRHRSNRHSQPQSNPIGASPSKLHQSPRKRKSSWSTTRAASESCDLVTLPETQTFESALESTTPATPELSRKQRIRAVKVMSSVEESDNSVRSPSYGISATPSSTSTTMRPAPRTSLDTPITQEHDDNFAPSLTNSRELSFGESPRKTGHTPTRARANYRGHPGSSSPGSPWRPRPVIEITSPTPSMLNAEIRQRRLDENGIVEQDKVEFAYQRYRAAMADAIAAKKAARKEEIRKQKGKEAESRGESVVGKFEETHKRKLPRTIGAPDEEGLSKRPTKKTRPESTVGDSIAGLVDVPENDASLRVMEEKQSERASQAHRQVTTEEEYEKNHGSSPTKQIRLSQSNNRHRGKGRDRREIVLPDVRHITCKCSDLHEYFRQDWLEDPSLADLPIDKIEFMRNIQQIAECSGHNQRLIDSCRFILTNETRDQWVNLLLIPSVISGLTQAQKKAETIRNENHTDPQIEDIWDFAQNCLAEDSSTLSSQGLLRMDSRGKAGQSQAENHPKKMVSNESDRKRKQSSIGPEFYGLPPKWRASPMLPESLQYLPAGSMPEPSKTAAAIRAESLPKKTPKTKQGIQEETPPRSSSPLSTAESSSKSTDQHRFTKATGQREASRPRKKKKSMVTPPTSSPQHEQGTNSQFNDVSARNPSPLLNDEDGLAEKITTVSRASRANRIVQRPRFNAQRNRHQSLPPILARPSARGSAAPQTTDTIKDRALQELSTNTSLPASMIEEFAQVVRREIQKEIQQLAKTNDSNHQSPTSAPQRAPPPTGSVPASSTPASNNTTRTWGSKMSVQDRRRLWPEQPSDVPYHLRKSEPEIIEIGRMTQPYERHCAAPYAFSYWGTLRKEYRPLITRSDGNGGTVWTLIEIARVQH